MGIVVDTVDDLNDRLVVLDIDLKRRDLNICSG